MKETHLFGRGGRSRDTQIDLPVSAKPKAESGSSGTIYPTSPRERVVSIGQYRRGLSYRTGEGTGKNTSLDKGLVAVREACDLAEADHRVETELVSFDQEKIDRICEAMVLAALREARRLGTMAVEETGCGVPADEEEKNRSAAEDVWARFRYLRTVGVIAESKDFLEVATPRGVVSGIVSSTSPTSTAIFMVLISIKARNTLVLSPHHSAARGTNETVRVLRAAAIEEGLPADAIRCMTQATTEGTEALMKHEHTAAILATGGTGLVKTAYSSGKPAFSFAPGTIPDLSPLHLMDIERIAFDPQPGEGTSPSVAVWELQEVA
jgi:acyl-CoA reductase-like NAD-dependent aldehyde dehydrogenase